MSPKRPDPLSPDWRPPLPPRVDRAEGAERRIGVELEMAGAGVSEIAGVLARHVEGKLSRKSEYEIVVESGTWGDWNVELDFELLKRLGREGPPEEGLLGSIEKAAEGALRMGAEIIVPVEIVSPPLPMSRLGVVQTLIPRLRSSGALGTEASLAYAFGMQFNPELPDLEPRTIASYLKSFFCLEPWLTERAAPDLSRRVSGFAAPFPASYLRRVVDTSYWPSQSELIDDYLEENPTRNRALDMLPLFLHVDSERVRAIVDDERVKARPTLHYRLPNCEIDRPDWGLHFAWQDWVEVERLADDSRRLEQLCERLCARLERDSENPLTGWIQDLTAWISGNDPH